MDLVEDNNGRKYALKRIQCHSNDDEKVALKEVEYMRGLHHPNLVALETAERHSVQSTTRSVISEVNIVMPFYRVSSLMDPTMKKYFSSRMNSLNIYFNFCRGGLCKTNWRF